MMKHTMNAIYFSEYGPSKVLSIRSVAMPLPGPGDLLIRIRATSVNYGDLLVRKLNSITPDDFNMPLIFLLIARLVMGWRRPKRGILGSEFSGEIVEIGDKVTKFKVGDQVLGYVGQTMGAYAEYICVPETGTVALKPSDLSDEEAAVLPYGAIMAFNLLQRFSLKKDQEVLIIGASGGIGSAAVQIAANFYGVRVTGVCSTVRHEYVKSLGAVEVYDYNNNDYMTNGGKYDLIFDILGIASYSSVKSMLKDGGMYLLASFKMKQLIQMFWHRLFSSKKMICAFAPGSKDDLLRILELAKSGVIKSSVDKIFSMDQAADAHRYVEGGNAKGKVAIRISAVA